MIRLLIRTKTLVNMVRHVRAVRHVKAIDVPPLNGVESCILSNGVLFWQWFCLCATISLLFSLSLSRCSRFLFVGAVLYRCAVFFLALAGLIVFFSRLSFDVFMYISHLIDYPVVIR